MRSADDARRNHRPGDVVIYGPQWQLTRVEVVNLNGDKIHTLNENSYPMVYLLKERHEYMANAEVLHVAQEGGGE